MNIKFGFQYEEENSGMTYSEFVDYMFSSTAEELREIESGDFSEIPEIIEMIGAEITARYAGRMADELESLESDDGD